MAPNVAIAILAAAAVAAVLPSPRSSISYVSRALPDGAKFTPKDLRSYAEALVEVRQIKQSLDDALAKAPPNVHPILQRQAHSAIAQILLRHQLPSAKFNQISQTVDTDPTIRRNVRQFVMEEQLGV